MVQRQLEGLTAERARRSPDRFTLKAALLVAAASAAAQWRLLIGRVPMPADLVTRFAVYRGVQGVPRRIGNHAELSDLANQFYPFRLFADRALAHGHLATWNPRILEGAPFLANIQSALLYPPNVVLYGLLPANIAWSVGFWLRPVLAGACMALLSRALGATRTGACVAAIAFGFCGFVIGWSGWPQADVIVWLPLALYAVHRLRERATAPRVAGTAAALAMLVLAGHPEVTLFSCTTVALFAAHRAVFSDEPRGTAGRYGLAVAGAIALAAGLSAAQTLPAIEWIGRLHRLDLGSASVGAAPLRDALTFVSRDAQSDPNSLGLHVTGAVAYIGIVALIFAPVALLHRNRRDVAFFAVVGALAGAVAYDLGPPAWVAQHLPFVHAVAQPMALGIVDLALAVLAGFGVSAALESRRDAGAATRVRMVLAGAVLAGLGAIAWAKVALDVGPQASSPDWFRRLAVSVVLVAVAALLAWMITARRVGGRIAKASLLAVVVLDSASFAFGHVPMVEPAQIYPEPPAFAALRERDSSTYRIASLDGAYSRNAEMVFGFDSAAGYDFPSKDVARLLDPLGSFFISYDFNSTKVLANNDHRLDLMNVKYLFVPAAGVGARAMAADERFQSVYDDGAVTIFENRTALPRAFLVSATGVRPVAGTAAAFDALADPEFDPARAVLIDSAAPRAAAATTAGPAGHVTALIERDTEVVVQLDAAAPAVLVLSDAIAPGWRVEVDGHPTELLRADAMFRGVMVERGAHTVRFVYDPASVRWGVRITLVSVLVLVGLLVVPPWVRRRR